MNIVAVPPASLRKAIGTLAYYKLRNDDFVSRADPGETAPTYYLGYGDKYVRRFTTALRPKLSRAGAAWLDCTLRALQTAIENKRDANPWAFAELERNDRAFHTFAYATHPASYTGCGVCDLSIVDETLILMTPDWSDLLEVDGLEQMAAVFAECNWEWFAPRGPAL